MSKKIELFANAAVIAVAVLFATTVARNHLSSASRSRPLEGLTPGAAFPLKAEWSGSHSSLVLVLSRTCHFCSDSAPFYRRLVAEAHGTGSRLMAILPQPIDEGRHYLRELDVEVEDVRRAVPAAIGVRGTPTLILVNNAGVVQKVWRGRLPPAKEDEVMAAIGGETVRPSDIRLDGGRSSTSR